MAETIPGGFYQDAAGQLRNANGEELTKEQKAQAQKHAAQALADKAEAERVATLSAAQRDPVAKALVGMAQPAMPDLQAELSDLKRQIAELNKEK